MIAFWAQSLDNESPNSMTLDGKALSPSEEEARQKIISDIYGIVSEKTKIKSLSDVTMYRKASKFVFEVIPLEKDVAERLSPIIVLGDFPDKNETLDVWVNNVCDQLLQFTSEVMGRTLSGTTLTTFRNWLTSETLGSKKKQEQTQEAVTLSMLILLPLIVGWFLQMKLSQLPLIKIALVISGVSSAIFLYSKTRARFRR
jgi:hypothetical protein